MEWKIAAVVVVVTAFVVNAAASEPPAAADVSVATPPTLTTMPTSEATPAGSKPVPATSPATPAPMRIAAGSKLYIEPTDFGMALAAAILTKRVPVVVVTERSKGDFFVQTLSQEKRAKSGEKIARLFFLGGGSGDKFNATVTILNGDGSIIFAHNSKKENFQSAAQNIAKNLKKHIEGQ